MKQFRTAIDNTSKILIVSTYRENPILDRRYSVSFSTKEKDHEQEPGCEEVYQERTSQDNEGKKGDQEGQERGKEAGVMPVCARACDVAFAGWRGQAGSAHAFSILTPCFFEIKGCCG